MSIWLVDIPESCYHTDMPYMTRRKGIEMGHKRYRARAVVRRFFRVATITRLGKSRYYVTWPEGDSIGCRPWRWWDPRDLPWWRRVDEGRQT